MQDRFNMKCQCSSLYQVTFDKQLEANSLASRYQVMGSYTKETNNYVNMARKELENTLLTDDINTY